MQKLFSFFLVFSFTLFGCFQVQAQILHSENFNVVIDSSQVLKGNFSPSFRYRNLENDFIEISNTADVSLRIGNNAFTIANQIEYSILGNENILSGGYLYLEYINLQSSKIAIEPFYQMHWNEVRGLDRKYALGSNLRWMAFVKNTTGLFLGVGALVEFERWNYMGVPEERKTQDTSPIEKRELRASSYLSFKHSFGELFDIDLSVYYQPTLDHPGKDFRAASSFELTYNFTKYVGLRFLYQTIYDSKPVVPIDKLYNDVNMGLTISF